MVSGVGASEGPARVLVAVLAELGFAASFSPLSAFFGEAPPPGDVLVVVSQKLSPNARVPFRYERAYAQVVLFTTLDPERDELAAERVRAGTHVIRHGPDEEPHLLLRVLGPAVASVAVVRAALRTAEEFADPPSWARALAEVPARVAAALERGQASADETLFDRWTALVCGGGCTEVLPLVRGKLVEGLGLVDPPVWDAMGVVHGPFQAFFERPVTLLYYSREGDDAGRLLRDRLAESIVPDRHRLHCHEGSLPGPLVLFEHDAATLGMVLSTLERRPRNLIRWAGQGADGPVYSLAAHPPRT